MTRDELLSDVLQLSPVDKADFVEKILESFEFSERAQIDKDWAIEVEKRIDDFERGDVTTISLEDAFNEIQNR